MYAYSTDHVPWALGQGDIPLARCLLLMPFNPICYLPKKKIALFVEKAKVYEMDRKGAF